MIPETLRGQRPMLASPVSDPEQWLEDADDRWLYELKFDGVRVIAYIDEGTVRLVNRNMVDVTYRYPDVAERLGELYPYGTKVFDGEMLVFGTDGRPDFNRIARRDRQTSATGVDKVRAAHPATFVAFDLLCADSHDLRLMPLAARHALLGTEAKHMRRLQDPADCRVQTSVADTDGQTLWAFALTHRLEGLIAKRKTSRYAGRRSPEWVKLKPVRSLTALVTGYESGQGSRADTIGALHLSLLDDDGELRRIGKVGTGFTAKTLALLDVLVLAPEPIVVEVGYAEVTADGALRFPSFKGFSDRDPASCTIDQLRD